MNPTRWERVKSIFDGALAVEPARRAEALERLCGGDTDVRAEVERLLAAHASPTTPYRASEVPTGAPGSSRAGALLRASERIGSYRVLRVLGEGGMGIVYLAEQEKPRRTVALKMIRPGVASAAMLKRFEHESHVLGRLQHPGIAQVYEAGTADAGHGPQPFFAMELIQGRALPEFARARGLGTRERVELFTRVCDAVHHAHQKGIVHRDLKPGNILVDESGQPKVLDFGVARATDSDIQATTLQTDVGQLIGTVPYMSPEQAAGFVDDVDTRSDVYSLGVILFEMLTGSLPYDVSRRPIHEAVRVIREDEPARLSSIDKLLRGDIETIVGKALLKERARRYQSAADLADDLRRYLASQPIKARTPTAAYQIARFAKQHRAYEASEAMAVNKFLQELLASSESIFSSGKGTTVRQILERVSTRLETGSLKDRPELEAELRTSIGLTYQALGLFEQAESHLGIALETRRRLMQSDHPQTAAAEFMLGRVVHMRGRLADAEGLLRRSLATRVRTLGEPHADIAEGHCGLADVVLDGGRAAEAEPLYRAATRAGGSNPDQRFEADVLTGLGACLLELGRASEGEPMLRRCLELQSALLPEGHWQMVWTRGLLGACAGAAGRFEEAEPLLLGAWADLKSNAGAPPLRRRQALERLVSLYESWGEREKAEEWRVKLAGMPRGLEESGDS